MPSGSYKQVAVLCPFFRTDDGKQVIVCEGFGDSRSLTQTYRYKKQYETQMKVFCCEHYRNCEVYQLLMESKYDEEDVT